MRLFKRRMNQFVTYCCGSRSMQDVAVSPREHNRADATEPNGDFVRWAVYAAIGVALVVTLWALAKGNDRDLWFDSSAVVLVTGLATAT